MLEYLYRELTNFASGSGWLEPMKILQAVNIDPRKTRQCRSGGTVDDLNLSDRRVKLAQLEMNPVLYLDAGPVL